MPPGRQRETHASHQPQAAAMPATVRATRQTRVEEVPKAQSSLSYKVRQLHTSPHAYTQFRSWSPKGEKSDRLSFYFPRHTNNPL